MQVSRLGADLNKLNAQVLGVTVDTFFALKAWSDAHKFTFPLLSDFNKEVTPPTACSTRT